MNRPIHTCCGQRIRARVIDGKLVELPHECPNDENKGVDWARLQAEQIQRVQD